MKRFLASALVLSSFSLFALVGCEDTSTSKTKVESSGPGGSTTVENKQTVKTTGDNPPPVEPIKPEPPK
jgi:hypothetical protein